jgi:hypothetical protein
MAFALSPRMVADLAVAKGAPDGYTLLMAAVTSTRSA